MAEVDPYFVSLLTGFRFAWILRRRAGRTGLLLAFLAGGLVVLWLYAVAVLCGVPGICL